MRPSIIIAALLLGIGAPPPRTSTREEFHLETGGKIDGIAVADFQGDGLLDLLVITERQYRLFLHGEEGFRSAPDQIGIFEPRAVLMDVGDVNGDASAEVVLLTTTGYVCLEFEEGRFPPRGRPLVQGDCIFRGPSPEVVKEKDLLRDIDGNGREDLIFPTRDGLQIWWAKDTGGFRRGKTLEIPVGASVEVGKDSLGSKVISSYWFPEPHPGDYTGDGRTDMGVLQGEDLWIFAADEEGVLGETPTRRIPIRTPKKPGQGNDDGEEGTFRIDVELPLKVQDMNGDGFPDFVSTHVGEGSTHIFLGAPSRKSLRTPSQIVKVAGFAFFTHIHDLDGDGLQDLVVASVPKIGLWGALKVFITRSITAEAHVYYNRGRSLYPLEPDYRREVDIPIVARKGERVGIGTTLVVTASGDLDGDGLLDLVLRTAPDRLGVFAGKKRAGFAEEPAEEIPLLDPEEELYRMIAPAARDLDGDGRSDLILHYYGWDRADDHLTVVR